MVAKVSAATQPRRERKRSNYLTIVKQAWADWSEDRATRLAAALAFYTMLSLAPLLVLAVKAVGVIFSEDAAKAQVRNYLTDLMGLKAGQTVTDMMGPFSKPGSGLLATTISVIVLLMSASGVFGELQDSLNTIWEVKPKPNRGILDIIRERFFSMALVLGVCFLLLVSLMVTTALAGLNSHLAGYTPLVFWHIFNFTVSMVIITGLFAVIFKYLPDAEIRWRDVWEGALTTGILFSIGKLLLGWYLGRASTTSAYAAAGSVVSVLLWVYYSAQILFFGAEMTQACAKLSRVVQPAENAVAVTEEERAQQGIPSQERVRELAEEKEREAAKT